MEEKEPILPQAPKEPEEEDDNYDNGDGFFDLRIMGGWISACAVTPFPPAPIKKVRTEPE